MQAAIPPRESIRKMHGTYSSMRCGYGSPMTLPMELRHLRCLVAIVDAGGFTDAAIDLGISQAAVSRTLGSLEDALGVRLLHRTSRSVIPTTAGVQVLARARKVLAEADNLIRGPPPAIRGCASATHGRPWAGTPPSTSAVGPPATPDVELHLIRHQLRHRWPGGGPVRPRRGAHRLRGDARFASARRRPRTALLRHGRRRPLGQPPFVRPVTHPRARCSSSRRPGTTTADLWPEMGAPSSNTPRTSTTGSR